MTFVKRLLMTNKKIGLVFMQEKDLTLQARSCIDSHSYWEKFVSYTDIELDNKTSHIDIPRTTCWALIIPAYQCITKYAVLPSTDSAEIEKMLEYELPSILSYNSRHWVWDFSIIGRQKDGSSKILIVLSPMDIIDHHIKTLLSLGIKPDVVIHSGMFYAFLLSKEKTLSESNATGCFCIDDDHIDFFVIESGQITFLRGVRLTEEFGQNIGPTEVEIRRSLSMVKEHSFTGYPSRFLAINTNSCTADFAKTIETALGISIKEIKLANLYAKASTIMDGFTADSPDNYLSPAPDKTRINLLPRHLKEKQLRGSRRKRWALHGLKICLVLFLAFLCLKTSIRRENRLLERYEQRLSDIRPVAEKLQFLQQQLSIIENQLQGNISPLDIIFELYKSLPADITVHYLSIEQNEKVRIRAQAKLLSQAFDCIGPLEQSDFFQNVRQSYANQRRIGDSILIDFEIVADLQKKRRSGDAK